MDWYVAISDGNCIPAKTKKKTTANVTEERAKTKIHPQRTAALGDYYAAPPQNDVWKFARMDIIAISIRQRYRCADRRIIGFRRVGAASSLETRDPIDVQQNTRIMSPSSESPYNLRFLALRRIPPVPDIHKAPNKSPGPSDKRTR